MIALWSNRYEFSSPENLLALAKTILRRKIARLAERAERQRRFDGPSGGDSTNAGPLQVLASPEAGPAAAAEFRSALDHVCRQLNDRERHILTLLLQGQTRKEIAEGLGEDPHSFRVYWGRVMARLRGSPAIAAWMEPATS
jgi:DNA-binding CsgD family transcriptional regulator